MGVGGVGGGGGVVVAVQRGGIQYKSHPHILSVSFLCVMCESARSLVLISRAEYFFICVTIINLISFWESLF